MKKTLKTPSWDAILDTEMCDPYNNAELTIQLRVGFKQINPSGRAANGVYPDYGDPTEKPRKIVKWSPADWVKWKGDFVRSAQRYWSGKFWLINDFSALEYEKSGVKYFPNVWCRFQLVSVDPLVGMPHHTIDVVKLDKTEKWFGSHSTLYDNLDSRSIQKGWDSNGKAIMQRAHVHEIGHLLGLGHVDIGKSHCPNANTNATPCYGVSDSDKNDVMGSGMIIKPHHATPWRRAITQATKKGTVGAVSDWEAKKVRHYPRTTAEVAANATITKKPNR